MLSLSTCVICPICCWLPCERRRKRLLTKRTLTITTGKMMKVISVSRQLRYISKPSKPITLTPSLASTVITLKPASAI